MGDDHSAPSVYPASLSALVITAWRFQPVFKQESCFSPCRFTTVGRKKKFCAIVSWDWKFSALAAAKLFQPTPFIRKIAFGGCRAAWCLRAKVVTSKVAERESAGGD